MRTDFTKPTVKFDGSAWDKYGNLTLDELLGKKTLGACVAAVMRLKDAHTHNTAEARICRLALDWFQSLETRLRRANDYLGALKLVEFTSSCCNSDDKPVPGTETLKVMAYNTAVISEQEALDVLESGRADLDDRVVVLWPQEAAAMFPGMHEEKEDGNAGK